ncbi:hypothetical protein [Piscinibacter sp.]|uniref:hypothetical protein n=1 Tax=Piscinibacter sp. TaxID=1903157 RepID=UPI002C6FB039|nr:hypothetical protein [Albitalea sp.]HUG24245.1 hypothetical protein [Albitalea sp.]
MDTTTAVTAVTSADAPPTVTPADAPPIVTPADAPPIVTPANAGVHGSSTEAREPAVDPGFRRGDGVRGDGVRGDGVRSDGRRDDGGRDDGGRGDAGRRDGGWGDGGWGDGLRPFGDAADLGLDFGSTNRPGLVTSLLAQGDAPSVRDFWWAQTVSRRTAALLRLLALTDGRAQLALTASCASAACGEAFEFDLPLSALPDGAVDGEPIAVPLGDGRSAALRRPTGDDLRRWRDAAPSSRREAVRSMLDALVVVGQVSTGDEAHVAEAIAAMDPLVAFSVACRCPACGAANDVAVDLEALALKRLASRQRALLLEVHRFASAYGWTEAEVLAVPPARRARYLELIDDA